MPLNLASYQTIIDRIRTDVTSLLSALDPTTWTSLIKTITDSNAGRHYDNVLSIKQLERELFPTKDASIESLAIWAAYESLVPFYAKPSSGLATFFGVNGTTIPEGTEFKSSLGETYITDIEVDVASVSIATTLSRVGNTVTAVTDSDHNFASTQELTIAGAIETEYNGIQFITVTGPDSFTYEIDTTPSTPATGSITTSDFQASVKVNSEGFGLNQNLDSGAKLNISEQITGIGSEGLVQFGGLIGGTDLESSESILKRIIQSRANPVANFNISAITLAAFGVQGVTRVKVKRITPDIGSVTILFVRDEDDDIIPDVAEVLEVKNAIVELLQATSDVADVIVTAPTAVIGNYSFTSVTPNTKTMKEAIGENIKAFYEDEVTFEEDIQEEKYRAAIANTIDPKTGDTLQAFVLASPVGDITIGVDEIGVFGEAIF